MKHLMGAFALALSLLTWSCEKSILGPEATATPPTIHQTQFETVLDSLRYALDCPALAAAIVSDTGFIRVGAVGSRRYGGPANVTVNDRFHLGSCGKAFTAALLGTLVDNGLVSWTTTLPEIFPEFASTMRSEYRAVTVRDILSHSAGFQRDSYRPSKSDTRTLTVQREEIVGWALSQPPVVPRGNYLYSNLGFLIAGAVIEKVSGRPYEELMAERIFGPLNLTTAAFGVMGTVGLEDQPLQHTPNLAPIDPTPDATLQPTYNSAGGIYMSIGDWGKFIQWILSIEYNHQTLLKPATARELTSPIVPLGDGGYYGFGWGVGTLTWSGGKILTHTGSNGYNYSEVEVVVNLRFGIVIATNRGAIGSENLLEPALTRMIYYQLNGR